MKIGRIDITIMSDGHRTVTEATYHSTADRRYRTIGGTGSSSRSLFDKPNQAVGEDLAVARALRSIAAKLEKQAYGAIKHAEDTAIHRAAIRAENENQKIAKEITDSQRTWYPDWRSTEDVTDSL